ncbi:LacI family DNA-binding transcriptional regulator [Bifidobacterium sp. LC6]|uniref:LacI family DNA-binding transcriptional regulator n=1 Tax=Bifidobacterium colobi TaxID=2809026 RepID=A0ABS5UTJ0_9BIFI|nr:LacI family DNA-binding transcriptional regulator [Bifidobacterium colobi]MBT1174369.1 LacI family DNA-binding transcriptional regulator [Bifidobacterium colobi]
MPVTMEDVAREAGVSRSAVSLALNDKPGLSPDIRQKILETIDRLDYSPLRKRKVKRSALTNDGALGRVRLLVISTGTGMIRPDYRSLPFFDSLVSQLSEQVGNDGGEFQLEMLSLSGDDVADRTAIARACQSKRSVPTVVLGIDLSADQVGELNNELDNVVFADTHFPGLSACFVTMDNFQGAYAAAEHMIAAGHSTIGYVASNIWISNFQERRRGFFSALRAHGLEIPAERIIRLSPTRLMPERDAQIIRLTAADTRPSAIFCENDVMAVRLIKDLQTLGINVPRDIAVMGFDDIPEGRLITPELTTVHVPISQIADQSLRQLKAQAAGQWKAQTVLVSTEVVSRASL